MSINSPISCRSKPIGAAIKLDRRGDPAGVPESHAIGCFGKSALRFFTNLSGPLHQPPTPSTVAMASSTAGTRARKPLPRRSRARLQWCTTGLVAPHASDDSHCGHFPNRCEGCCDDH
jgi:hypothetical protein